MEFLNGLPAHVRFLALVASIFLGAFASHLPEGFQTVGYCAGWIFAILTIEEIVRHHAKRRREAGLPIVEPNHLILAGLCGGVISLAFVAGGYGWLLFQAPKLSSAISLSSGLPQPTPEQNIVNRAKQLSKGDKEDLTAILRTLSSVFDEANSMIDDARKLDGPLTGLIENANTRPTIPERIKDLKGIRDHGRSLREKVSQAMANGYFREYVNYILGQQLNPLDSSTILSNSADEFMMFLAEFQKTADMSGMFLRPEFDKFRAAIQNFSDWVGNGRNRLDVVKRAL